MLVLVLVLGSVKTNMDSLTRRGEIERGKERNVEYEILRRGEERREEELV